MQKHMKSPSNMISSLCGFHRVRVFATGVLFLHVNHNIPKSFWRYIEFFAHILFISFVFNFSFQDHEIVGYQYGVRNMDARSNGSIKPTKTELFSQKMAAGLL